MAMTSAMNETLELPLKENRVEARWFGGGGCVVMNGELGHVFVRGTLVGSFRKKDVTTRNLLMVSLAQGEEIHLERLAAAFGYSPDGLRRIRRLYESEGGRAVMERATNRRTSKVKPATRRRLEEAFEVGASVTEAWQAVGRKAGHGRSLVGEIRLEWAKHRRAKATEPEVAEAATANLTLAPPPAENATASAEAATANLTLAPPPAESATASAEADGDSPAQSERAAAIPTSAESGVERVMSVAPRSARAVQHLGSWLLVAMVARLGLHEKASEVSEERVSATALRVALDAVVVALALGEKCVEGVRRLATSTAASLLMATGAPSPSWTRRTLGRFAADNGGISLHLKLAGEYVREAQATATARGPVFYVDNHLRPYTGKHVIRRGWRMQDKRVRPGTSDYYVHDEDGRPVMRLAAPDHGSLTEWLSPVCALLRMALPEETILVAFDRAGAFPEQMATLRDDGFEFVTYERRPFRLLPEGAFTEKVVLDGETLLLCDTRKNLGNARGRVRRIAVRLPDGHQLNLLANSKRTALELVEVMSGRWRQENGFKHGVERWGINQLDGRTVVPYPPGTIIPNPARRRLDRAIRIARVREGAARAALARLAPDSGKRHALQRDLDEAVAEQVRLEALRPSTPPKARLEDTELADTLVQHTVEYKLVLDTIRIACANAESDLASMLAPKLPRAAEAKKTLANLLAASGEIRAGRKTITVCLSPAGTRPEQRAFGELLAAVNRLKLSMPGDQQARPLRFMTARK